ncbi:MAG: hypothetical protein ACREYE_27315, partial [Gammaproteobacteria bacterium]
MVSLLLEFGNMLLKLPLMLGLGQAFFRRSVSLVSHSLCFFASSAEFVGTDLRRIYASDSLLGIKLRSIGPKFWVSKNLLG